jgi:hypothetical protein
MKIIVSGDKNNWMKYPKINKVLTVINVSL